MSPPESLRIATRALRVNKLRSALTVLGIVVGVASVVCMVSVGAGAQAEISEKIRTLGANLLLVMPGARNSGGARLESGTQPTLTEEDAAAIRRELPDVQVAAPLLSRSMPLVAGNRNWVTLVAGVNPDYLVAREWQAANGRSFTGDEIASGAKVAIVGSVIIEELFGGRVGIGETFRIGSVPFTVVGVSTRKDWARPAAAKTISSSFLCRPRKAACSAPCVAALVKHWISFPSRSRKPAPCQR